MHIWPIYQTSDWKHCIGFKFLIIYCFGCHTYTSFPKIVYDFYYPAILKFKMAAIAMYFDQYVRLQVFLNLQILKNIHAYGVRHTETSPIWIYKFNFHLAAILKIKMAAIEIHIYWTTTWHAMISCLKHPCIANIAHHALICEELRKKVNGWHNGINKDFANVKVLQRSKTSSNHNRSREWREGKFILQELLTSSRLRGWCIWFKQVNRGMGAMDLVSILKNKSSKILHMTCTSMPDSGTFTPVWLPC